MKTDRLNTIFILSIIITLLSIESSAAHFHLSNHHSHDGGSHHHSIEAHTHSGNHEASDHKVVEVSPECRLTKSNHKEKLPDINAVSAFQAPTFSPAKIGASKITGAKAGYLFNYTFYLRGPPLFF